MGSNKGKTLSTHAGNELCWIDGDMALQAGTTFRFENCAVDPIRRTLFCAGQPVVLSPKTFDLLLYLVNHSERVVTKEELINALWPDMYVDESNLSQHAFLLRRAFTANGLGDHLLVTVPRRGYQFTATVETSSPVPGPEHQPPEGELLLKAVHTTTRVVVTEDEESETGDRIERAHTRSPTVGQLRGSIHRNRRLWIATASILAIAVAAGLVAWFNRPRPVLRKVVLAQFQNHTGEAVLDDSLQSGLRIDLEQSPYVDVMSRSRISEILESMGKPANTSVAGDVAREVCERGNYQVLLMGGIASIGSQYLLTLEATSCATGDPVAADQVRIESENNVLGALDSLTRRMRRELGESRRQVAAFQVPLAYATTSSLEALRAYSQALNSSDRGDVASEEILLQRAISLDTNFASAYKELASAYNNRQDFVQAGSTIRKAYELRDKATGREKMAIEIAYDTIGTLDYEAAIAGLRSFNAIYPDDASSWFSLCNLYSALGQYPQAVEAGEHAYQLSPHSGRGAEILVQAYRRANRFADAKRVAAVAIGEGKELRRIHSSLLKIAFAENDEAGMKAQMDWELSHPQLGQAFTDLGFVAASQGKVREARADFARSREEAVRSGDADFADDATMFLAGILLEYGDPSGARASLNQMSSAAIDEGTTAYFRAELGDLGPAQKLISKIEASNPKATLNLYFDLPELRACIDLVQHRPQQAVIDLEPARKYQLRDWGVPYQRARAEVEAGMLDEAIADYRLILANSGIEPIWPEFTLTHLRLARVLAQDHKVAEARMEYQALLDTWKNADPDLPLFVEAKREFAALRN